MRRIVVDASACLKWIFEDEEDADLALNLLSDTVDGKLELISPTLWLYEVSNAVRAAILKKRINLNKGKKLLSAILKATPELSDFSKVVVKAFDFANKHDISVYDASYATLAAEEKTDLYTGDEALYRKLKKLKFVKLISQY